MDKIYVCTEDSIVVDLLTEGNEEEQIEGMIGSIIREIMEFRSFVISNNYICSGTTAIYLKKQYGINCIEIKLEWKRSLYDLLFLIKKGGEKWMKN